jgi:hypothetical protein
MKNQVRVYASVGLIIVGMMCVASVQGDLVSPECGPYSFSWIWDGDANPDNGIIGQQQLSFTVSNVADGVYFKFTNSGDQACSLTDIYFESSLGTLESLVSIDDSCDGVSFSLGAAPGNMPRWQKVDFEPTLGMLADSDVPHLPHNGVNPGE